VTSSGAQPGFCCWGWKGAAGSKPLQGWGLGLGQESPMLGHLPAPSQKASGLDRAVGLLPCAVEGQEGVPGGELLAEFLPKGLP